MGNERKVLYCLGVVFVPRPRMNWLPSAISTRGATKHVVTTGESGLPVTHEDPERRSGVQDTILILTGGDPRPKKSD